MAVKNIDRWVAKQIERASAATEDFREGVRNCDVDPPRLALAANDKRIQKLKESITKKTWENSMSKVTKQDWLEPTLAKADRFSDGVSKAEPKIRRFVQGFRPHLEQIQKAVQTMPDITEQQREQRMLENLRRLRQAKGKWR
jgi:hypothetical protein